MRTLKNASQPSLLNPAVDSHHYRFATPALAVCVGLCLGAATACGSDGKEPEPSPSGHAGATAEGEDGEGGMSTTEAGAPTKAPVGGSSGSGGTHAGGAPQDGEVGGEGGATSPVVPVLPSTTTTLTTTGGTLELNEDDDEAGSISVPAGALEEATDVTLDPAVLPETAPDSVEAVAPGFTIDFGGATLTLPATAKLRLAYSPTDGDLVILVVTDSGTGFVTYTLETEDGVTYAVFRVAEGGRYLPVRLKHEPGCDEVLATPPKVSTQADVDKLAKVRRIVGNLQITGTAITSLAKLACLQQLDGTLAVSGTSVTKLDGLENLTFVGTGNGYYTYGVQLTNNSLLDTARLPSVLAVGNLQSSYSYQSVFQVQGNPVLSAFAADSIESAALNFVSNGAASTGTTLSMAALKSASSLTIQQNPALHDLDGLKDLQKVVGDLNVTNNGLTNMDGLESLVSAANVAVSNNVALTSAKGLSKLQKVTSLSVTSNQLLKSLNLAELSEVSQSNAYGISISVNQNAALAELKADKLPTLAGSFSFQNNGNASVNTVLSLASLKSIRGSTSIMSNLGLQGLGGLDALETAADLTIQSNAALKSLAGLGALETVGSLTISSNGKLTEIAGLTQLERIDENLQISQNASLKSADFPAVATMGGPISVTNNAALTSFSADALRVAPGTVTLQANGAAGTSTKLSFAGLSSVAGQLYVYGNPGLQSLDGFGALLSVGADLTVSNNAALKNLASLTKLSTVTGGLTISQNAVLTGLSPLAALTRVTEGVNISNNELLADVTLPALTSADGVTIERNPALATVKLDALAASSGSLGVSSNGTAAAVTTTTLSFAALTAASGFTLYNNPKLKAVTGFPLLSGVSGGFAVYSNVLLPNCSVVALRNQIQSNGAISGTIRITGNLADGCATTP